MIPLEYRCGMNKLGARLVLFDIDGTLVDSSEYDAMLFKQAIRDVLDIDIGDNWSSYRNVTDAGILDEVMENCGVVYDRNLIHDRVKQLFFDLHEEYLSERPRALREVPGARKFLDELRSMDSVTVAIATGGWEETARMKLEGIGIETTALALATCSDASSRTEIIRIAEQRALAGRVALTRVYFGDGIWDKYACEALDYDFIAIGNGVDHATRFPDFMDQQAIFTRLEL